MFLAFAHIPNACDVQPQKCTDWEHVYAETPAHAEVRLGEWADQLAYEAYVRDGSRVHRIRQAVRLGAIMQEESSLALLVDDGSCNERPLPVRVTQWHRFGDRACDGGAAWGPFQFHPDTLGDVYHDRTLLTGPDLIASKDLQTRIAWDLLERRPVAWTMWPRAARRAEVYMAGNPIDKVTLE